MSKQSAIEYIVKMRTFFYGQQRRANTHLGKLYTKYHGSQSLGHRYARGGLAWRRECKLNRFAAMNHPPPKYLKMFKDAKTPRYARLFAALENPGNGCYDTIDFEFECRIADLYIIRQEIDRMEHLLYVQQCGKQKHLRGVASPEDGMFMEHHHHQPESESKEEKT